MGIGFEQKLFKNISLLAGFRTDFSNYKRTDQEGIFVNNGGAWDLYNCSAGLSYHRKKQIITVGLTYSFSTPVNIEPFAMINPNQSDYMKATVSAQSYAISIGYTYFFPRE